MAFIIIAIINLVSPAINVSQGNYGLATFSFGCFLILLVAGFKHGM